MDRVLQYIGLARKSGKLVIGTDSVIKSLQNNKIKLILIGSDASSSTLDKMEKKAFFYHIPLIKKYSSMELSFAVGKRSSMVFGLTDKGFAEAIMRTLQEETERGDHNEG